MAPQRHFHSSTVMTDDRLRAIAPSIFAVEPWHRMSGQYEFIPTIDVVNKMRAEGFQPFSAIQSRTRIEGKAAFTKHMIRFRDCRKGNEPAIRSLGQVFPELVLTNSHDGASTYNLDAGLFRLVCLNGAVVSEGEMSQIKVRHNYSAAHGVIEASYQVVEQFPKMLESVEKFSQLQLTAPQQRVFAAAALELRYDDENPAPIAASDLLRTRRHEDSQPTLWNTFNTVQENVLKGGLHGTTANLRRMTTRPVNGINENTKLNKALWTLTEEMRKLVAAA